MGRTPSRGKKQPSKSNSGKKKAQPVKKSSFAIGKPYVHPGSSNPLNYIYGGKYSSGNKKSSKRSSGTNTKKQQHVVRKGKKKAKFVARLPVVDASSSPVPWWKKKGVKEQGGKSHKKEKNQVKILNALSVNGASLRQLNEELEEFANYVRLTPTEVRAREYLVQKIQQSCKNLFGIDESQCQVFGSFATKSVCIFESDIDLAIWGVVEPDDKNDGDVEEADCSRTKQNKSKGLNESYSGDERTVEKVNSEHPNRKKQDRVLVWKEVIDGAFDGACKKWKEKMETKPKPEGGAIDDTEQPLFVLDRMGQSVSTEKQSDVSDMIGSTSDSIERDENDKNNNINTDEDIHSDDDSADKLEALWSRSSQNLDGSDNERQGVASLPSVKGGILDESASNEESNENDDDDNKHWAPAAKRARTQSLVSLSSSTTCSEDEKWDESGMEVSFMVDRTKQTLKKPGPLGRTRTQVVNALYRLTRPLRTVASKLHVRKKARVPIINMVTHFGFECDIAMGGHNGADTSSFAATQVRRFKSFSYVVLVLKVLLGQQGLDKPFTGGLGSYSLYVLVTSHIERHVASGGSEEDPAEVLYSFFFRYGAVQHSNPKIVSGTRTKLSVDTVVQTEDGGSTDLSYCFQIESCVTLFEACWRILHKKLSGNFNRNHSILQFLVDAMKLELGRSQSKKQVSYKLNAIGDMDYRRDSDPCLNIGVTRMLPVQKNDIDIEVEEAKELVKSYGQKLDEFLPVETPGKTNKKQKSKKKKRSKTPPPSHAHVQGKRRRTI